MICVPITAKGEAALVEFREAQKLADLVELRLDLMGKVSVADFLKEKKLPVIVTNRRKGEGGAFSGSENERIKTLLDAAKLGANYVDVEFSSGRKAIGQLLQSRAKVIVSYHNFSETPENLAGIYEKLKGCGCYAVKIATLAKDAADNFRIFQLMEKANSDGVRIIAMCLGKRGEPSRVLYRVFVGMLTFASLSKGSESAPGQLTVAEMSSLYNAKALGKKTRVFGTVGNPVSQSMGPLMHNPAFRKLGLDCVFLRFETEDIEKFMQSVKKFRGLNVGGFAVTMPHKQSIMRQLDYVDETAERIGAVNTVAIRNGRFEGFNTDWQGAVNALKQITSLSGKTAVVLGAGGAARAVVFGLRKEGARVVILNKTREKAAELAAEFRCGHGSLESLKGVDYDVLVNCTPVGMFPSTGNTPVDKLLLKPGAVVMDIVYHPLVTRLLKEAADRGCKTVSGTEMLLYQAIEQLRIWTGKEAPERVMRKALQNANA